MALLVQQVDNETVWSAHVGRSPGESGLVLDSGWPLVITWGQHKDLPYFKAELEAVRLLRPLESIAPSAAEGAALRVAECVRQALDLGEAEYPFVSPQQASEGACSPAGYDYYPFDVPVPTSKSPFPPDLDQGDLLLVEGKWMRHYQYGIQGPNTGLLVTVATDAHGGHVYFVWDVRHRVCW